jgi:uncharacterized protein
MQPEQDPATSRPPDEKRNTVVPSEGVPPAVKRRGAWRWVRDVLYNSFIAPLVASRNPPWFDARGVAIGLVVGFLVPVGAHILSLTCLRMAVRFNFIVAIAFTWVCDPFNMVFMYYGYYCLGSFLLGLPVTLDFEAFRRAMNPVAEQTYFWEVFSAFVQLGREILLRWIIAAVTLSFISGPLGYLITYWIQTKRCAKKARAMGLQYEKYVQELETRLSAGKS